MLKRISEPRSIFSQTSGTVAEQVIASSSYVQTHVLLREALQNSCDQRIPGREAIDFRVGLHTIEDKQLSFLKERIFDDCPREISHALGFLKSQTYLEALSICDDFTTGLDGSTDPTDFENYGNFLNFFLVFGQNKEKQIAGAGGSAGLGRTVLTSSSYCKTILVFSRVQTANGVETRFMGFTNEESARHNGKHLTGRHWWGAIGSEGQALPVTGEAAEEYARSLGITDELPQETGTLILILMPVTSKKTKDEPLSKTEGVETIISMVQATEIYAWPHLLSASVNFQFTLFGKPLEVRKPADIPVIRDYAKAYQKIGTKDSKVLTMNAPGNVMALGSISYVQTPSNYADEGNEWLSPVIPDSSVALMRQARFVVKYLPVLNRNDGLATRGVFISDPGKADRIFRDSEPAAHDDWQPEKLALRPGSPNPVKITYTRISEVFKHHLDSRAGKSSGEASGAISRLFGLELSGLGSWGPGEVTATGGVGGGRGGIRNGFRVLEIGNPSLDSAESGQYITSFLFQLEGNTDKSPEGTIEFSVSTMTSDGSKESKAPLGASPPEIRAIRFGKLLVEGNKIVIPAKNWQGHITVIVASDVNSVTECSVASVTLVDVKGVSG